MNTNRNGKRKVMLQNSRKKKVRLSFLAALLTVITIGLIIGITLVVLSFNSTDKYLGMWNYDQPDSRTMTNVATISGGYALNIPQIGTVTFSKDSGGQIIGHTDQGCMWHFMRVGDSLQLTSPTQYCFNHVVNSGYNIYYWKVSVKGSSEQETLKATSFLPTGVYSFMLQNGKRTKASIESTVSTFGNFDGTWTFDPADPKTQVNIVNLEHMEANGTYAVRQAQQTGSVRFSSGLGDTIRAHTDNGCTWTLESHGNTAELMPAAQSCTTSAGTTKLTFFAVASNGQHQIAIMAGINAQGDMFQMIISSLSK